jgi:hypothetical protein
MSWRVKLAVVFVVLWAMGTINQRLDQDRTFNPPPAPGIRCTEDEYIDPRLGECIHIDAIRGHDPVIPSEDAWMNQA